MDRSSALTRRGFARLAASAAVLSPIGGRALAAAPAGFAPAPAGDRWLGLKMGIATYTFSKLPLEKAIEGIKRVDLHYASIKDAHLPLKSTPAQRKEVVAKFKAAGITPLSCGVITPRNDDEIRNMFEYARDAGLATIVCKPTRESLPTLDKMVKEYDLKVAIHNHGPEDKVWPSPLDAWEAIGSFDPRIGVCIDVGHTARTGVDPISAIKTCSSRLYDMHIKDIEVASGNSRP